MRSWKEGLNNKSMALTRGISESYTAAIKYRMKSSTRIVTCGFCIHHTRLAKLLAIQLSIIYISESSH
jgi:hypothetical protein